MTDSVPDTVPDTVPDAGSATVTGSATDARSDERSRRRAMMIRAVIYIAATHVWAGFMILVFTLGKR
ncbi:DUF6126 family protein [Kitasatospora sp. NPDC057015]|uniref:DUF6126 family protein n=1 Tax=Kitasatospora sp. NPDC057015 TaxID=3346001 RepID=UPI00363CDF6F